jgi:pullulanase
MLRKNMIKLMMLMLLGVVSVMFTACGGGGGGGEELSESVYTGSDLGCTYTSGSAILKLWAPNAKTVKVNIYDKSNQDTAVTGAQNVELTKDEVTGVWSVELNTVNTGVTDLSGYFYQYKVDGRIALDPYAKSMAEFRVSTTGTGSDKVGKGVIVNTANTDVAGLGFATLPSNWKKEDAVIWEIHIRDFTSQKGLELNGKQFGTYSAFKEKLGYLKDLGVTHIQLLPVMSFYYGDESKAGILEENWAAKGANYNWGYDPHSYFALEGMYATNRTNGEARIKEFKELVKAIHDEGMAVTLDVVYNHTADQTIFDNVYPGYFYRSGKNSSGCGNDTASERTMFSKMIVDSLVYWTKEYKVDGFRFDLMGILDTETVQKGYDEVKKINPNTLFIGEGWRMYSGPSGTKGADQDWMTSTNDVAVFSDEIRNELKSGYGSEGQPRFLTNGARKVSDIFKNIKAQPGNFTADQPGDVVQYIEAHDNLTLHDVITQSMVTPKDGSTPLGTTELTEEKMHKRVRLGNTIILTSQGIAFLHAGQEYGRTKEWKGTSAPAGEYTKVKERYFIHNSYDSSDIVNEFDWKSVMDATTLQNATMKYTKGIIALRNSTDAFRLGNKVLVDSNVKLEFPKDTDSDKIIAYSSKATNGEVYYVLINADITKRDFTIAGLNTGTVLVDSDESGTSAVSSVSGVELASDKVTVEPLTAIVIKK